MGVVAQEGAIGQEFKMVGSQGPDQGVRGSKRPDGSRSGQMG